MLCASALIPEECRGRESNPHDSFESQDFKSCASANFATPAWAGYLECTRDQGSSTKSKDHNFQFAVGGCTPSTTVTSTGARSDSSFNPS